MCYRLHNNEKLVIFIINYLQTFSIYFSEPFNISLGNTVILFTFASLLLFKFSSNISIAVLPKFMVESSKKLIFIPNAFNISTLSKLIIDISSGTLSPSSISALMQPKVIKLLLINNAVGLSFKFIILLTIL